VAFSVTQVLVGTGVTFLGGPFSATSLMLTNTGGTTCFFGFGTSVGTANGAPLPSGGVLPFGPFTGSALYALTASGTATVGVVTGYPYS
jgi:hypothetical protein